MFDYALIIDVLVSLLLGSMLFFTIIVTPVAFTSLESDSASKYMRMLFPRYFLWGIILSLAALGVCLFHLPKGAVLMVVVLVGFIYSKQWLVPKIHTAKDQFDETGSPQHKARIAALHKRSVIINVTQITMLVTIIIA